jgi:tetratricopeptide (TPR) repeat protein
MRKYLFIIVIYVLTLNSIFCNESPDEISKVNKLLNHSNTYYWLSRVHNNDPNYIKKTIFYADKAKELLLKTPGTKQTNNLLAKANIALEEAEEQKEVAEDVLWGFSGLIPLMTSDDEYYEYYDDIDEIAVEHSIETLCSSIAPAVKKHQLYLVILDDSKNVTYEEVAHAYINANTGFYALTKHELLSAITYDELNQLYANENTAKIFQKLSSAFSSEGIGVIRIIKNDEVDNIFYFGSTFAFWEPKSKRFIHNFYADGFCEAPNNSIFAYLLLLLGFFFTWFYNTLNKNKSKGSFPPIWYGAAAAVAITIFEPLAFRGIRSSGLITPDALLFSLEGILGLALILILLAILPVLVIYISSIKIPYVSKILNNPETISTIFIASMLGTVTYLTSVGILRYNNILAFTNAGIFLLALTYPAFVIGRMYSKYSLQNDGMSAIQTALTAIASMFLVFSFIQYDTGIIISYALVVNTFVLAVHIPLPLTISLIKKMNSESEDLQQSSITGIAWLKNKLDNPPFFICNKTVFDNAIKWITDDDDDKIDMVFIEGDQGCGKTRMAYEIAEKIAEIENKKREEALHQKLKNDETTIILFGDCDDPSAGAVKVPYEPFAQALGDFLGVGQFANPTEKAEKLKSGLAGIAIDAAMNASGFGAFSSLLGTGEEGETCRTNTKEMTKVIAETLTNISQTRKIIFILDDTQWMDDETFELFELLLNELNENFNDNQINFILTSRKVDDNDKIKDLFNRYDNTGEDDKTDIIDVFHIEEDDLQSESIVSGVLDNLQFDYNAQEQLVAYFESETRPLPVLMTLKLLLDRKQIIEIGNRFELDKDLDINELPPPDYYSEILNELTRDLSLREKNLLQCCAIIGQKFNISIVSNIFGVTVIDCIELLKKATEKNIIKDVLEEDDIFEFVEKRVAHMFRILGLLDDAKMTQEVREFHKEYLAVKEEMDINDLTYQEIMATAKHAIAVKDVYPELVVKYNRIAAIKTYQRGLLKSADNFFKSAYEVLESRKSIIPKEEVAEFYLSYAKCLLDQEKAYDILEVIILNMRNNLQDASDKDFKNMKKYYYEIELQLIDTLGLFRTRNFKSAVEKAEKILENSNSSVSQKIRAAFYRAISWNRQEYEKCKELHIEVFDEIESTLQSENLSADDKIEILKVKSELANNFGFVVMRSEPDLAMKYFNIAIPINEMPEINDQKGVGIANGEIGDCLSALGDLNGAKAAYLVNYEISKRNGDTQGIGRMSSMLGGLILRELNFLKADEKSDKLKEASKYYRESLAIAIQQGNNISIAFAVSGLINVEAEMDHPDLEYLIIKTKDIDLHEVPDFASGALKEAMEKFIEKYPKMSEQCDIIKKQCNL